MGVEVAIFRCENEAQLEESFPTRSVALCNFPPCFFVCCNYCPLALFQQFAKKVCRFVWFCSVFYLWYLHLHAFSWNVDNLLISEVDSCRRPSHLCAACSACRAITLCAFVYSFSRSVLTCVWSVWHCGRQFPIHRVQLRVSCLALPCRHAKRQPSSVCLAEERNSNFLDKGHDLARYKTAP